MQVRDVMTRNVISIAANETVLKAARVMLQNRDQRPARRRCGRQSVGIVTEGDFLRRGELGTQRRRPKWLEFVLGPGRLASEYVHASGRKIEEVMTARSADGHRGRPLETVVGADGTPPRQAPSGAARRQDGRHRQPRQPHARAGESCTRYAGAGGRRRAAIRDRILAALGKQRWAPRVDVVVKRRRCGFVGHDHRTNESGRPASSRPRTSPA